MATDVMVRGEGNLQVPADLAVVQVAVEADGATRDAAYAAAVPIAGRVDVVLAAAGAAIERAVTTMLTVQRLTRWDNGQEVEIGWRARRSTTLEVADLAGLTALLAELTMAGGSISGPTWRLRPSNPAHTQVRQLAGEDARARAEAYAVALGLRILGVAWVAEPGLRGDGGGNGVPMARTEMAFAAAASPPRGGADGGAIEVEAAELTLQAAVEVGFTFAPVQPTT